MTTPIPELEDLAARCESATGPDQDLLLQEVWTALFPRPERDDEPEWGGNPGTLCEPLYHNWKVRQLVFQALLSAKAYLDAAMTLVPERHKWAVTQQDRAKYNEKWWGELRRGYWTSYDKAFVARAATPALALCAASLRAIAKENSHG